MVDAAIARHGVVALTLAALLPVASAHAETTPAMRKKAIEHFRAGEKALQAKELAKAESELKAAIEIDPQQALALYSLGRTYLAGKRYAEALDALERCAQSYRDQASLQLQGAAEADDRREESIRTLRESLRQVESGGTKAADQVQMTAQLEQQLRELERTKRRGSEDAGSAVPAPVLLSLGAAHFRLGHLPEAESAYRQAIEADPKLGEAHNNLAILLMMTGKLDDADREVKLAEKAGFKVHPRFKEDLASARQRK